MWVQCHARPDPAQVTSCIRNKHLPLSFSSFVRGAFSASSTMPRMCPNPRSPICCCDVCPPESVPVGILLLKNCQMPVRSHQVQPTPQQPGGSGSLVVSSVATRRMAVSRSLVSVLDCTISSTSLDGCRRHTDEDMEPLPARLISLEECT